MGRMLLASLVCLLIPSTCLADPIYVEKGTSAVADSSASGAGYVVQGGTLNILPGANLLDVWSADEGGQITVSGGQITVQTLIQRGSVTVTGGTLSGTNKQMYGPSGMDVLVASARILGGTFVGGNGTAGAGAGLSVSGWNQGGVIYLGSASISGGTFQGGTTSDGRTGYSLASSGNATINGGHFLGPIAVDSTGGGVTDFLGNHLSYNSATSILSGTLASGDPINVHIDLTGGYATVNSDGTDVRFAPSLQSDPQSGSSPPTTTASNPDPTSDPAPTTPSGSGSDPTPVPEPGSLLIFGLVALGAMASSRFHRQVRTKSSA